MIALFVLNVFQISAQNNDEVTLVVSADGATKEEATKVALRSAIEQAYGTFVSANTTILNDELVKDEIVTISSGNIKNYKEVTSNQLPDGRTYVTLQATVSISKLISYAQNKGATAEFAGAAFAMDMKMKELNKQNELIAINHMEEKLNSISHLFDFTLELKTPEFSDSYYDGEKIVEKRAYKVKGKVDAYYNENTELYNTILFNTLNALCLSENEKEEYEQKGISLCYYKTPFLKMVPRKIGSGWNEYEWSIYLRNEIKKDYGLMSKIENAFIISDNISSPTSLTIRTHENYQHDGSGYASTYYWEEKESLFGNNKLKLKKYNKPGDKICSYNIEIFIPQENIGKYSKFTIESK